VRPARILCALLGAISLVWVLAVISPQTYRPLMLLVAVVATFAIKPSTGRFGRVIDAAWIAGALAGLAWPLISGEGFWYRAANPTNTDLVAGLIALAVVVEAARRTTGWILPMSALVFVVYAIAGPLLVSIGLTGLAHRGYDLQRLIGNLYMTLEGLYGLPLDVAVTYIILFSVYGAVLERSGAGQFFLDWSMSLSSRGDGHQAAAAGRSVTLAGFLLGTVSGSGVATTVTLGSVAWPVLKRVGFAADTAGAMLAASGIGALLSPPTLGAAAFLIAEYLRISYLQVLIMATIPTLLYYLSILLMIEGETRRLEHGGVVGQAFRPAEPGKPEGLPYERTWRRYLHFSSLVLVAVLMAVGLTPFRAVFWATLGAVAVWMLMRETDRVEPASPRTLYQALGDAGEDVLSVIATTAVAGIIVGVITLTGLGLKAAGLIVGLASGSLPLTVLFSAAAVWILGLAVPVTASYIISAVMVVPALTSVGVSPVAAHMFIFYYAVLSEVSPPTALAPFAAAALTGGKPFRTMMLTWKYSLPAFVVPFAFTLDPRGVGLLLQGGWVDIVLGTGSAMAGVAALAYACSPSRHTAASWISRGLAALGGLCLVHPAPLADLAGLVVVTIAVAIGWRVRRG